MFNDANDASRVAALARYAADHEAEGYLWPDQLVDDDGHDVDWHQEVLRRIAEAVGSVRQEAPTARIA